jgi:hypothetical protein
MEEQNGNGGNSSSTNDNQQQHASSSESLIKPADRQRRQVESVRIDLYHGPTVCIGGLYYPAEDEAEARLQYGERQEQRRRLDREAWVASPQGKMCLELYQKFMEYKAYLEKNPWARRHRNGAEIEYPEHLLFADALAQIKDYENERVEKARKNLEKARQAARCEHHYMDGEQCAAPRLRDGKFCRMHQGIEEAKAVKLDLGPLEDPDSIQAGIRKLVAAVVDGRVDRTQSSHLGYLIQLAAWNVMRTSTGMRAREIE